MTINQATANLIDTLATAASKIGGTPASAKISKLIVDILPATTEEKSDSDIAEAFRLDNIALQEEITKLHANDEIKRSNLELVHSQLHEISELLEVLEGNVISISALSAFEQIKAVVEASMSPVNV